MSGIDPYAAAVSDVYQDLFGEGSYAGKGIYDVDAFEAALAGRVPDSTLLSHDLFEGIFARAGLASDVEVVEEFPARYDVAARASTAGRAATGSCCRGSSAAAMPRATRSACAACPRSAAGRCSTICGARCRRRPRARLLAGWACRSHAARSGPASSCDDRAAAAHPGHRRHRAAAAPGSRCAAICARSAATLRLALSQTALMVTFLAHQAWLMATRSAHAVAPVREPPASAGMGDRGAGDDRSPPRPVGFYRAMAGASSSALAVRSAPAFRAAAPGRLAAPFVALWIASPGIARWASVLAAARAAAVIAVSAPTRAPAADRAPHLAVLRDLRHAADHMLPPDNFQEDPDPCWPTAPRRPTSACICCPRSAPRDFGWIGTAERSSGWRRRWRPWPPARVSRPFLQLVRHARSAPARSPYVSSVDSGNLAGHLIALANACREWIVEPPAPAQRARRHRRRLDLAREPGRGCPTGAMQTVTLAPARRRARPRWRRAGRGRTATRTDIAARLAGLAEQAAILVDIAAQIAGDEATTHRRRHAVLGAGGRNARSTAIGATSRSRRRRPALNGSAASLEAIARAMALAMEFGFLLDPERKLLSIGYRVPRARSTRAATTCWPPRRGWRASSRSPRATSPARHWFRLGRAVTPVGNGAALISWSGSMFEYLMPSLVMRAPAGSLLEQTNRLIVRRQIAYGATLGIALGHISESAYNARDLEFTYQYSNFGVPASG
jgi:cyclic beta-1,2-glucan synthetase